MDTNERIILDACGMYGVDKDNVLLRCYVRMYLMHMDGVAYPPDFDVFERYSLLARKVVRGEPCDWTFPEKEV